MTSPKTPRKINYEIQLTRNSEIVKICEQWENFRIFGSRGVLRSLRDVKIVWNKVGGGLVAEYGKTRERVRVSNVRDMKI